MWHRLLQWEYLGCSIKVQNVVFVITSKILAEFGKKVVESFRQYQRWYSLLRSKQHTEATLAQLEDMGRRLIDAFQIYDELVEGGLQTVCLALFNLALTSFSEKEHKSA